jgi:hypothetical protein
MWGQDTKACSFAAKRRLVQVIFTDIPQMATRSDHLTAKRIGDLPDSATKLVGRRGARRA